MAAYGHWPRSVWCFPPTPPVLRTKSGFASSGRAPTTNPEPLRRTARAASTWSGFTDGSLGAPNAGGFDAWLARYDSAGSQVWIRQLGTSDYEAALAAAPDGSGGVYVSGDVGSYVGSYGRDGWLARYDTAGNQSWIRQLGTSNDDTCRAAASDGSGGVYVGGATCGSLGGSNAGASDAWLARYDSLGNQLWILQLGTSVRDGCGVAAPDSLGGVYVGGTTQGSLSGSNAGALDTWLARYDSAGNQLWIRQLGTSKYDHPTAACAGRLGWRLRERQH